MKRNFVFRSKKARFFVFCLSFFLFMSMQSCVVYLLISCFRFLSDASFISCLVLHSSIINSFMRIPHDCITSLFYLSYFSRKENQKHFGLCISQLVVHSFRKNEVIHRFIACSVWNSMFDVKFGSGDEQGEKFDTFEELELWIGPSQLYYCCWLDNCCRIAEKRNRDSEIQKLKK